MLRRKIGLLINQMTSDYTLELLRGAEKAAQDYQADLYIFSSARMNSQECNEITDIQYTRNALYEYSVKVGLDAVVIAYDGIKQRSQAKTFNELMNNLAKFPCVVLETQIPGFRCVQTDQRATIRRIMDHLIQYHGYRRIGCIRGPVGSSDADLRYQGYMEAMKEYGLPCGEDYVETGDFSLESGELVRNLIARHPDLQAVVCANDFTAVRACEVLRELGYTPGKDIGVTGCDNIEESRSVSEPITTMEMEIYSLGYEGLHEAIRLLDGLPQQTHYVPSKCVFRESCGCRHTMEEFRENIHNCFPLTEEKLPLVARTVCDYSHKRAPSEKGDLPILPPVVALFHAEWMLARGGREHAEMFRDVEKIAKQLHSLHMSASLFLEACSCVGDMISESIDDPVDRREFLEDRLNTISEFIRFDDHLHRNELDGIGRSALEAASISDAVAHSTMVNSYMLKLIAQILIRMNIRDGCLLLFPAPVPVIDDSGEYVTGDSAALAMKIDAGEIILPENISQLKYVPLNTLLNEIYAESGCQAARMVFTLQSEGDQFGLFICEIRNFNFVGEYTACYQIGSALKYVAMQHQHYELEQQLHSAIRTISEKNAILEQFSNFDALTGVYNRRGLIESMNTALAEHLGRTGTLLFMDINSLKQINDRYGHNAGDFAISSFAKVLRGALRKKDIIGRYGGDEFMALLIHSDARNNPDQLDGNDQSIRDRVTEAFDAFNRDSGKPFYVEGSMGVYTFHIDGNVDFGVLLATADKLLYEDKKNKRKDVAKVPQDNRRADD